MSENRKQAFRLKNGREYSGYLSIEYDESGDKVDYKADSVLFREAVNPFDDPWQEDLFDEGQV